MKRAIVLVDHGSVKQKANAMLADVARLVQSLVTEETIVEHAHMEIASPSIKDAFEKCVASGAEEVIVHPYFLSPGKHSTLDIPRLVKAAADQHPSVSYRVTEPLGLHTKIAEVVLERVAETENEGAR